jgi:DNA modification methylase
MFNDLELQVKKKDVVYPKYILGDARKINIEDKSVDLVITSPPYLNRNNYISQQKAELSFLNLVHSEEQYKSLVQSTIRSHTDADLKNIEVSISQYVDKLIANMEFNEGNNKSIKKMIIGYFNDLDKTLEEMHRVLKKDGKCAFVVGNTRWGGVVVPVDHLLANFAELRGFRVKSIFVTRMKGNSPQQMKQFGRIPVRESVVIFEKT